jgi:cell division protein FtsQ
MATSSAALPHPTTKIRRKLRPRARWIILALIVVALLAGLWMWVKDSALVSVDKVTVTGLSGATSKAIDNAVTGAAQSMTTLDFDPAVVKAAVAPYPIVKSVEVRTHFPHGVDVIVHQHVPVATILLAGRDVPVAADGTLLQGTVAKGLPSLAADQVPTGTRVTQSSVLAEIRVLAGADAGERARVKSLSIGAHGVELRLHGTVPVLYFGDGRQAADQWVALKRVLADPASQGATYIDLRVASRPAAGGFDALGGSSDGSDTTDSAGGTDSSAATDGSDPAATGDASGDPSADSSDLSSDGSADSSATSDSGDGSTG